MAPDQAHDCRMTRDREPRRQGVPGEEIEAAEIFKLAGLEAARRPQRHLPPVHMIVAYGGSAVLAAGPAAGLAPGHLYRPACEFRACFTEVRSIAAASPFGELPDDGSSVPGPVPQPGGITIVSQGGSISATAITGAPLPSGLFNLPLR
jgi:hypothetical protein